MSKEVSLALLTFAGCLGVTSCVGYAALAAQVRARGGRVSSSHFYLADFWVTIAFAVLFIYIAGYTFTVGAAQPPPVLHVKDMVLGTALNIAIAGGLGAFLAFRRGSFISHFGLHQVPIWRVPLYAAILLMAAYPGILLFSVLMKSFAHASDEQIIVTLFRHEVSGGHWRGTVAIFLSATILAPLTEEFAFRGYFYGALKRQFGIAGAALLTSALFALIHVNLSSLPALFFLALCLTVAYEWTGSLLVPIAMHALFNTTSLVWMYLEAGRAGG